MHRGKDVLKTHRKKIVIYKPRDAKDCYQILETRKGKEGFCTRAFTENDYADTFILDV